MSSAKRLCELVDKCMNGDFEEFIVAVKNKDPLIYEINVVNDNFIAKLIDYKTQWDVLKSPTIDQLIEHDEKIYRTLDKVCSICFEDNMYDIISTKENDIGYYFFPTNKLCFIGMIKCVGVIMKYFTKIPCLERQKYQIIQQMIFWSSRSINPNMLKYILNHNITLDVQKVFKTNGHTFDVDEKMVLLNNIEIGSENIEEIFKFYRKFGMLVNGRVIEQCGMMMKMPIIANNEIMSAFCCGKNLNDVTMEKIKHFYGIDISRMDVTCDGYHKNLHHTHISKNWIPILKMYSDYQLRTHLPVISCVLINKNVFSDNATKEIIKYLFERVGDVKQYICDEYIDNMIGYLHEKQKQHTIQYIQDTLHITSPLRKYEEPLLSQRLGNSIAAVLEAGNVTHIICMGDGVVSCQICYNTTYNIYYCIESRNVMNKHYVCKNCLYSIGNKCPMCRTVLDTHNLTPQIVLEQLKSQMDISKYITKH